MHKVWDNHHIIRALDGLGAIADLLASADQSDLHMVRAGEFSGLVLLIKEEIERGLGDIAG